MTKLGRLYLICSDRPRNGKTLLARFCASYIQMLGREFRIIDLEHERDVLSDYFPEETTVVDMSATTGQIELFDSIIAEPELDYVIEVPARYLNRFFEVAQRIDFFPAATEAGMTTIVFYIVDKSAVSLDMARRLQRELPVTQFVEVYNEALGPAQRETSLNQFNFDPIHTRELKMPRLREGTIEEVEQPDFSLLQFMATPLRIETYHTKRADLSTFLKRLFSQFQDLHFKLDIENIAHRHG